MYKNHKKAKTKYNASFQVLKLPPIKSLQVSSHKIQSAKLNCIREWKSQVWKPAAADQNQD